MNEPQHRRIRSFVRRPGRITASQQRALTQLWPVYGVEFNEKVLDLDVVYQRQAPRVLDIGFGDGEALVSMAAAAPDTDFLGVEVHEPGVGHLLGLLQKAGLDNVRVIRRDVVDVMAHMLSAGSLSRVNIYFPDPWPKKRHHKRRLIQPTFLRTLADIMAPGATLHIATDWAPYAAEIHATLAAEAAFIEDAALAMCLPPRPPTKFERRGRQLGHRVADMYFIRRRAAG